MKYVCDLWLKEDSSGSDLLPFGYFIFESEKLPTAEELSDILIKQLPLLQNNHILNRQPIAGMPGGYVTKKPHHYVSVFFRVDNRKFYLFFTNVRPVIEDIPSNINLYT